MICNIIMCKCFPTNGVNFDLPFNVIFFVHKKSNPVVSITGMQCYNNILCFPLPTDCEAAEDERVDVSCSGDRHLSVSWPTNITYTADVVSVPADLTAKLRQRIVKLQKQVHIFQLVILNRQPP